MQKNTMLRLLLAMFLAGLLFGGSGLYLLGFTDVINTMGMAGVGLVVTLITLGAFLIVPFKIYLILKFTRRSD